MNCRFNKGDTGIRPMLCKNFICGINKFILSEEVDPILDINSKEVKLSFTKKLIGNIEYTYHIVNVGKESFDTGIIARAVVDYSSVKNLRYEDFIKTDYVYACSGAKVGLTNLLNKSGKEPDPKMVFVHYETILPNNVSMEFIYKKINTKVLFNVMNYMVKSSVAGNNNIVLTIDAKSGTDFISVNRMIIKKYLIEVGLEPESENYPKYKARIKFMEAHLKALGDLIFWGKISDMDIEDLLSREDKQLLVKY